MNHRRRKPGWACCLIVVACILGFTSTSSADSLDIAPDVQDKSDYEADSLTVDSTAIDSIVVDSLTTDSNSIIKNLTQDSKPINPMSPDSIIKIKSGLHFFVGTGLQFIQFNHRSNFQNKLDTIIFDYRTYETVDSLSLRVESQNFQNVNLAFPFFAGLTWFFNDNHSIALGAGFLHDKESVVVFDAQGQSHNYHYALQAFPLFAEYRLQISKNLISLTGGDYFSLFFRYYWMLPHTEIYSSWGNASADFSWKGNGWGVFLGYLFWQWKAVSLWGELGISDISVNSKDIIFEEMSSWNLGGISFLFRAMF